MLCVNSSESSQFSETKPVSDFRVDRGEPDPGRWSEMSHVIVLHRAHAGTDCCGWFGLASDLFMYLIM